MRDVYRGWWSCKEDALESFDFVDVYTQFEGFNGEVTVARDE